MTAHQAFHRVATSCRVLEVSPSGYYAWRKRPLSPRACADVELTAQIATIHRESRGTMARRGCMRNSPRRGSGLGASAWRG